MIKGISRRVIVVKSPDRRFFEEAIFIVREGVTGENGVTAEQVLEEARHVAERCAQKTGSRWRRKFPAAGYMFLGALLTAVAWYVSVALA